MSKFDSLSNKLMSGRANKISKDINKEDFLWQLQDAWSKYVKKDCNIDEEVSKARDRIDKSGPFKKAFGNLDLTDEDLRLVIQNIIDEKPLPFERPEPKISRNEPCPCGSAKKYKKCCGK